MATPLPTCWKRLLQAWPVPVEELVIVGHSMGGLLARSACHYGQLAGQAWPKHLRQMVFLGTPHHGAPLERGGNWVNVVLELSPYTAALARLAKIRSAGITDLRHGDILDEDWQHGDRFARAKTRKGAVPLPQGVQCFAVGVTPCKGRRRSEETAAGRRPGTTAKRARSEKGRQPRV